MQRAFIRNFDVQILEGISERQAIHHTRGTEQTDPEQNNLSGIRSIQQCK